MSLTVIGIAALTGYEFGLIAVLVGLAVGIAVRKGSSGRGGWRYQVLAMFVAAGLMVIKGMGNQVVGLAVFLAILAWSARRRTEPVPVTDGRL